MLKALFLGIVKFIKQMPYRLPMHKIVRPEQSSAGKKVHSGTEHVVCIVSTDYVRIGIILFNYWIVIALSQNKLRYILSDYSEAKNRKVLGPIVQSNLNVSLL